MSAVSASQRSRLRLITAIAVGLALVAVLATLERTHYLNTHFDSGLDSLVTTSTPAPAAAAVYPSQANDSLLSRLPTGGVSLSSTPPEAATSAAEGTAVVAQVRALTAIAAVKACAARHGLTADCTEAKAGSLGTATGLTIVHRAPTTDDVRVIHRGSIYSATAAAARGVWYAVTVNVQTGAESRTCLRRHGKRACAAPNW